MHPRPDHDTAPAPQHQPDPVQPVAAEQPAPGQRPRVEAEPLLQDEPYLGNPNHQATAEDFAVLRADRDVVGLMDHIAAEKLAQPEFANVPRDELFAVHAYTRHGMYEKVNKALREGTNLDIYRHHASAVASGLKHMPVHRGEVVRRMGLTGKAAEFAAAHYQVGQVVVETQFTSSSYVDDKNRDSAFKQPNYDIKLTIASKTGRNISGIASSRAEREVLHAPGTQLLVRRNEIVEVRDPFGRPKLERHIEAEEITPDSPHYLAPDQARERIAERRERTAVEARVLKELDALKAEMAAQRGGRSSSGIDPSRLGGPVSASSDQGGGDQGGDHGGDVGHGVGSPVVANQPDQPETAAESVSAEPDREVGQVPESEWSSICRSTNPPAEPAIHAEAAMDDPETHVRLLLEKYPELRRVNGDNVDGEDAYQEGYHTNCTRCVVTYERRLAGEDVEAEPLAPERVDKEGTLDYVQQHLGGERTEHRDFDEVIRIMRDRPDGSRAVLGFRYGAEKNGMRPGHVVTVVKDSFGVAFIDPQTGTLARLRPDAVQLELLSYQPAA